MLLLSLATLAAAGCSTSADDSGPLRHQLGEPWQAVPFELDAPSRYAATEACHSHPMTHAIPPLAVVDARGSDMVIVLFAQGGDTAWCTVLREKDGSFTVTTANSGSQRAPPLHDRDLGWQNVGPVFIGSDPFGILIFGPAGPEIASVEVVVPSGPHVRASVGRGWFAAWWPGDSVDDFMEIVLNGYDAAGKLIVSAP